MVVRIGFILILVFLLVSVSACQNSSSLIENSTSTDNLPNITGYPIVSTNQTKFFNDITEISKP
ncbi:MAG: hypothetical protein D6830_07415, partial [Ignavibacteria bacterium]